MNSLPQTPSRNAQALRDAFEFRADALEKKAKLPRETAEAEAWRIVALIAKNRGFTHEELQEAMKGETLATGSPSYHVRPSGAVIRQGKYDGYFDFEKPVSGRRTKHER